MYIGKGPLNICLILSVTLLMPGIVSCEDCDLTSVSTCISNVNMAVLRENITAFCNDELGELSRCLQPYDTACQNDSTYQQYVQYFQPSTFGCQGISGLQCDMRAVFRCFTDMDMSLLTSNLTFFCNVELKKALDCVGIYEDVCMKSLYSGSYNSTVSSLEPELYGCSGTSGPQCEFSKAAQCMHDFTAQRMEILDINTASRNFTAECQLLKTADECLAPYENACTNNTSFSSFKEIGKLKDVLCKGTSGQQCEFSKAEQCMHDFNAQRMEILDINTTSRNFTAECQLLKTADECLAPYENACTNNTSFSSFKEIGKLKDVLCKDLSSSSPRLDPAVTVIVWSIMNICFIMN